jgi:hypothetical protein
MKGNNRAIYMGVEKGCNSFFFKPLAIMGMLLMH